MDLSGKILKNEIENAACTGIEFQPSELSYNEWVVRAGLGIRLIKKTSQVLKTCWSRDEDPSIIELKKQMCEKIEEGATPQKINLNRLKDIGRYILIKNKSELKSDIPIVGEIKFSRVVFNKEGSMAVFAAMISDTEKAIIEKLFILSKVAGKWKVIKVEIFAVS